MEEKVCSIFGAGAYDELVFSLENPPAGLVIAADGGYEKLKNWGISPHLAVGDFDSLGYVPEDVEVVRHPVRKDEPDMLLAVREGLSRGCRRFNIYGGLGGRLDHTLGNLQILAWLAARTLPGFLLRADTAVTAIQNGHLMFPAEQAGTLSLFAWGGLAEGVTLTGLSYPLEDAIMSSDYPLGVSNVFLAGPACVTVKRGMLLAAWRPMEKVPLPRHEFW